MSRGRRLSDRTYTAHARTVFTQAAQLARQRLTEREENYRMDEQARQIAELRQQLAALVAGQSGRPPIDSATPRYNGEGPPEDFCFAYEQYATLAAWTPERQLNGLALVLTGPALTWFRMNHFTTTFAALEALKTRFGQARRQTGDVTGLMSLRQTRDETIDILIGRLQEEVTRIEGGASDELMKAALLNALPLSTQANVRRNHPATFNDAVAAARDEERLQLDLQRSQAGRFAAERRNQTELRPPMVRTPFGQPPNRQWVTSPTPSPWRALPPKPNFSPQLNQPLQRPWQPRAPQGIPRAAPPVPPPKATEEDMEDLQRRLQNLSLNNITEARRLALSYGLCLRCYGRGHMARECQSGRVSSLWEESLPSEPREEEHDIYAVAYGSSDEEVTPWREADPDGGVC